LPKTRVLTLARFAGAAKAQAVARLPDERRAATLLAFIRALEASAQDDVLDLFDLLITRIFADAIRKGRESRLRNLRDLDAAALTLSKVCALVLDGTIKVADLREAVFFTVPQAALEAAVAQVDSLTRPPDDPYFDELLAQHRRIRRFLPQLVRTVEFGAMPAGQSLLKAVQHLRKIEDGMGRREAMPVDFVPKSWEKRVIKNGSITFISPRPSNKPMLGWKRYLIHDYNQRPHRYRIAQPHGLFLPNASKRSNWPKPSQRFVLTHLFPAKVRVRKAHR
jgi:hypothetical protein